MYTILHHNDFCWFGLGKWVSSHFVSLYWVTTKSFLRMFTHEKKDGRIYLKSVSQTANSLISTSISHQSHTFTLAWHLIVINEKLWHWNGFCFTGPVWGESTSHHWIPLTKGSAVIQNFSVSFDVSLIIYWTKSPIANYLRQHNVTLMWHHCNGASIIIDFYPRPFTVWNFPPGYAYLLFVYYTGELFRLFLQPATWPWFMWACWISCVFFGEKCVWWRWEMWSNIIL